MTPNPYIGMESFRPLTWKIDLAEAFDYLHQRVGKLLKVEINHYETFAGAGFEAVLLRVQELPPSRDAVRVVFTNGAEFFFRLDEVTITETDDLSGAPSSLEVSTAHGLTITVETPPLTSPGQSA